MYLNDFKNNIVVNVKYALNDVIVDLFSKRTYGQRKNDKTNFQIKIKVNHSESIFIFNYGKSEKWNRDSSFEQGSNTCLDKTTLAFRKLQGTLFIFEELLKIL